MNTRDFLKTIIVTPALFLLPKISQGSWRNVETDKGTLDLCKPYECNIKPIWGKQYNVQVRVTKDILIECPQEDGTIIYELNNYREYVKIIGQCRVGDVNDGPKVAYIKRYESNIHLDGKVTREMYNNFITQMKRDFEGEVYTEYLWSHPTSQKRKVIEV